MQLKLNGEAITLEPGLTVADLLQSLGKNPRFLAVERNRKLIPRTEHAACHLQEGDEIEIVTLVGGG